MTRPQRKPRRIDDPVELTIESLAFGGSGVARRNGKVGFVPGALPGEVVRAQPKGRRKKFDRYELLDVLEPSPHRRPAQCPHLNLCGGCSMQSLDYEHQLAAKAEHVRDCLERLGAVRIPEVGPPVASPNEFRYRNKMDFTFARRAWEPDGPPEEPKSDPALGLHVPGRFDAVFDLESCVLPSERVVQVLHVVRKFARERGLTAYQSREDSGLLRHLVTREGERTGDLLVALVVRRSEPLLAELAGLLAEAVPSLTGFVVIVNETKAAIARGTQDEVLFGSPFFRERVLDLEFELRAQSFFQTNTRGAERLIEITREMLGDRRGETLLDLYCGVGTLGLALARNFDRLIGVEQIGEAVSDARRNAARNKIANAEFVEGDVEGWIRHADPDLLGQSGIVVDPPRAGLHPRALAAIGSAAPPWLLYVSCNPSTLARDLAGFRPLGLEPRRLQILDLFPQTGHIESVVWLESTKPERSS